MTTQQIKRTEDLVFTHDFDEVTAMIRLGFHDWKPMQNRSLEEAVVYEAFLAYDRMMATGHYTAGHVPKPNTMKDNQISREVFYGLLPLANKVLNPTQTPSATLDKFRIAWTAGRAAVGL